MKIYSTRMHSGRRVGGRYPTPKPVQNAIKQKKTATADPSPLLFFPSPSRPFPSPPSPLKSRTPYIQLGGLGERCELPQWGLGRSPSRNRICCILALKYDIWWHSNDETLSNFQARISEHSSTDF